MEFVKDALLPGSFELFMILATIGVSLLFWTGRRQRIGRWCLSGLLGIYWLLSFPLVANSLVSLMAYGYHPIGKASEAAGAGAIVILEGGARSYKTGSGEILVIDEPSALRCLEAVRLYGMLDSPLVVISAGSYRERSTTQPEGAGIREALIRRGVPESRIVLDSSSRNTREHAVTLAPLLRNRGIEQFVLVTSPTHMRRAMKTFLAQGLKPIPSPAAARSESANGGGSASWLPSFESLSLSKSVFWDCFGLAYYWSRGWLSPSP